MRRSFPNDARTAAAHQATPLLTAQQVAARCQVALRTVRRWIATGMLPVLHLGRAVRIAETDLEQFLNDARQR